MRMTDVYRTCLGRDDLVQGLDPLDVNRFFTVEFSGLSERGETQDIVHQLMQKLTLVNLRELDEPNAQAATRDLAMVASTLIRWRRPIPQEIERALMVLADKTREVPADTVFSYGTRNPSAGPTRRFTTLPEEVFFIRAFSRGMRELTLATAAIDEAVTQAVDDAGLCICAQEAVVRFDAMIRAIIEVKRTISPECFTHQLRPFFDPKQIGGNTYQAPGGAQMPVILLDLAVWGAGHRSEALHTYWVDNMRYLPPALRDRGECLAKTAPLYKRCLAGEVSEPGVMAVLALLNSILAFRYPHLSVAKANFAIRSEEARGSGGYDTSILELLVTETMKARNDLHALAEGW